ncbi:hypothetical protein niasHS_007523 [Heterodera schachtii]|uniref:Golgin subfamily A member 7/ERF4 domain-containing protein n=1 Tax=Heterodera schachtii TaxID=97005 RepID=A0ABD2JYE2_HETSC
MEDWTITPEPIVIRGVGHLTMFGLNSHFSTEFPSALTGKLAPEEFDDTLRRVNYVLQRNVSRNLRWLICGLLFCCCSFGISLWPVVCLNRRTISALEKTLDHENQQLYNKLGLHWKLARLPVEPSNRLTEYVLLLETLPRIPLSMPD